VVVEHHAAMEVPCASIFRQLTFVAVGRELPARAIVGDQYQQVAGGARLLAGELNGEIADHMAELGAGLALRGEATGKGAAFDFMPKLAVTASPVENGTTLSSARGEGRIDVTTRIEKCPRQR
jgi:hypothetical protein